jgi:3',5'-cyclic AMP phosphodiesterase CpdA
MGPLVAAAVVLATILAGCGGRAPDSVQSLPPSSASLFVKRATVSPATPTRHPAATAPDPTSVTLIAAGDIGRCDSAADDATGDLVEGLPGVVATLGDTAYEDGTTRELEECFGRSWGGVRDRIRFAVTGNHDIHTDGGEPLRRYMGDAAAREGRTWFSDDLGAWHVVVLDSDCGFLGDRCGSDSDQVRWLREDLAASGARCTIALMHQPRFSSGQHGDSQAVRSLWDELYAADAELVLVGHDHDYERFAPQAPDGTPDDARGVVQIVVGTGGTDLEGFGEARPNSLVRIDDAHGVIELTLGAD